MLVLCLGLVEKSIAFVKRGHQMFDLLFVSLILQGSSCFLTNVFKVLLIQIKYLLIGIFQLIIFFILNRQNLREFLSTRSILQHINLIFQLAGNLTLIAELSLFVGDILLELSSSYWKSTALSLLLHVLFVVASLIYEPFLDGFNYLFGLLLK